MRERERLRWRCRRGMLELDLLLQGFLEQGYEFLSPHLQVVFCQLITLPDQELLKMLLGQYEAKEREWRDVIKAIRCTFAP